MPLIPAPEGVSQVSHQPTSSREMWDTGWKLFLKNFLKIDSEQGESKCLFPQLILYKVIYLDVINSASKVLFTLL